MSKTTEGITEDVVTTAEFKDLVALADEALVSTGTYRSFVSVVGLDEDVSCSVEHVLMNIYRVSFVWPIWVATGAFVVGGISPWTGRFTNVTIQPRGRYPEVTILLSVTKGYLVEVEIERGGDFTFLNPDVVARPSDRHRRALLLYDSEGKKLKMGIRPEEPTHYY